ncbi:translation initiation factor IF-2 [Candidatus Shapirobacteria bacterium CG_4_9_14_0_2_um_filter_39_11]|uniref:Translation initiation factor IF-2 n=1 Tax=Candidatus Shapirobacteria bacterium CG_4_9_14_0_2_um_filter_39_11 TaxID=1974478 RepID=A0A2M8ES23_9BACT|nr:MAG: translation initiation factor IF-2 [Candidatus Shapirobacteria bacterium CG_4_9_14_0_2_um_filter_39_11]
MVKTGKQIGFGPRPPVVVVLGHVDHGKTTLLDKIRQTNIASSEPGGITQHIGACQINYKGQPITFIDTPGHKAFSQMRSRGAKVADLAVLVVAVDEGVKPQTLESLKYIKKAGINYLVALNKIDVSNTNIERVKKLLSQNGIMVEGYGGDIVAVPISAKTGKGIDELLEMISLLAQMAQLKGNSKDKLEGVILESRLDPRRGTLATVLVRNGSLKIGDEVWVEGLRAKIRAMIDDKGKMVKIAVPSQPVGVLGFKTVPPVGGKVKRAEGEIPEEKPKAKKVEEPQKEEKKLRIILKADSLGTLEAIESSLPEKCQVILSGVSDVNESDVLLANTTKAEVIAFDVKISSLVKKLAEEELVKITQFKIIYELLEAVSKKITKFLKLTKEEEILGRAEIIAEFKIKNERIAGCQVKEGKIAKQNLIQLRRGEEILGNARIKSMKIGKNDVDEAKTGEEFGVVFSPKLDFAIGDMLASLRKIEEV